VIFTKPDGPLTVTFAPGITAPLSSVAMPRRIAVCAKRGDESTKARNSQYRDFIKDSSSQLED
jgi:hypothetical protein